MRSKRNHNLLNIKGDSSDTHTDHVICVFDSI